MHRSEIRMSLILLCCFAQSLSELIISEGSLQASSHNTFSAPLIRSPKTTDMPHMPFGFRAIDSFGKTKVEYILRAILWYFSISKLYSPNF